MGLSARDRGFSDEQLFMAMISQPKVAGMALETCKGKGSKPKCTNITQRFSYAIPLEIIYPTPLSEWNPYDIVFKGKDNT